MNSKLIPVPINLIIAFCILLFIIFSVSPANAVPSHLDKTKGSKGCSGCHKGHGKKGTPLLDMEKDELCFTCHSASGKAADIFSEVSKPSRHPVLMTSRYHVPGEELPEKGHSAPRHASCYDCHNVHKSEKGKPIKGLRGYSGKGFKVKNVVNEFELCYNCHSDSGNLPGEEMNIALDFSPSNASAHPVETFGGNLSVRSLPKSFRSSRKITCSDCHGSDDRFGPKGPHGSIYAPILKYRYNRDPGPESPGKYELCYSCHIRTSIISDQSFMAHKTHVVYNSISCAQCHDSHGSIYNPSLIIFDPDEVFPNSMGEITFMPAPQGKPRCFLTCHVEDKPYEHILDENLLYCVNGKCSTDW
jgi:predicted CXXCH cytochrome family protein